MRDGMRHQAVLVLGFVLLAPMMACGDTLEPLSEIDATVATKVVEERVAETKLQAMAKTIVKVTAQAVPTATPIPPTPIPIPKIFTDSGQSFGNSGSVSIAKGDLDSDSQQPTSLPSPALPDKLNHPRLDSRLNKLVGQIGSRSAADIAGSAPVSIGDLVAVTIRLSHNLASTVDFLKSVGSIVANVGIDYIETYTPVTVLVPLAEKDGVLKVEAIISSEPAVTDQ